MPLAFTKLKAGLYGKITKRDINEKFGKRE